MLVRDLAGVTRELETLAASGEVVDGSTCAVRLTRGDDVIVSGTAEVTHG